MEKKNRKGGGYPENVTIIANLILFVEKVKNRNDWTFLATSSAFPDDFRLRLRVM